MLRASLKWVANSSGCSKNAIFMTFLPRTAYFENRIGIGDLVTGRFTWGLLALWICFKWGNCLVQSGTYAPTGNRDLERDFLSHSLFSRLIAPTLRSGISIALAIRSLDGVGTGFKLRHDEPTFPNQIDRLNSYQMGFQFGI